MSYYSRNFNVPEGIDTLTFILNRRFLGNVKWVLDNSVENKETKICKLLYKNNVTPFITLRKLVILRESYEDSDFDSFPINVVYYLDIQTEAINPNLSIGFQIREIFYFLYTKGFFRFQMRPDRCSKCFAFFVLSNYFEAVASFFRIDFFFDLSEKQSKIKTKNSPQGFDETAYSKILCNGKSKLCAYSRPKYLIRQNMINIEEIKLMPYPNRLEIRFYKFTCDYMNMKNLEGNYNEVIDLFLPIIAKSIKKELNSVMEIYNTAEHPVLQKIFERIENCNETLKSGKIYI